MALWSETWNFDISDFSINTWVSLKVHIQFAAQYSAEQYSTIIFYSHITAWG